MAQPHLDGALELVQVRVEVDAQTGDGGGIDRRLRADRKCGETLFRRGQISADILALAPAELEIEGEPVAIFPGSAAKQLAAGGKVAGGRRMGASRLSAPAGCEVEPGDSPALLLCGNQLGTTVELVHDVKDLFLDLLRRDQRCEQAPDPQMHDCALPL